MKALIIMLFTVLALNTQAQNRIVFREDYTSITDVDGGNWKQSVSFKKGDTATYIHQAKTDRYYFKVMSKDGVVCYVYNDTFIDIDNSQSKELDALYDADRKKGDSIRAIRLKEEAAQAAKNKAEREAKEKILRDKAIAEAKAAKEKRDKQILTEYGQAVLNKVNQHGGIYIGAPRGLVIILYGYPERINKTVTASGTDEQMVYKSMYVYVKNNIVTSYQESY